MTVSVHNYDLPAPIWQVMPHFSENKLALLLRKKHKAGFLIVLPEQQQQTALIPLPEEKGSLELVGFAEDVLLFHRYDKQSSLPEPVALLAYDITGNVRWTADFTRLRAVEGKQLHIERNWQGRQFEQRLDLQTGEEVAENSYIREREAEKLHLPQLYRADSPYFPDFIELLRAFGQQPELGVEYLEWQQGIAISFYIRQKKRFRNELWLIDAQKDLLLQQTLVSEGKGIGQGTFWQFYDRLFAPDDVHGLLEIKSLC